VVLANKDHLTPIRHSRKVFGRLKAQGVDVTTLELDASHAFDEEDNKGLIMHYDAAVMQTSLEGLLSFVAERFGLT
jgi:dienelactone hydrolase